LKVASYPVSLARTSLQYYFTEKEPMAVPDDIPPELLIQAGAFVSLKKQGQLRGCIGTFLPTKNNAAAEIIANAISAATRDPRFWPITAEELAELEITVDLLDRPEIIADATELDPGRYGVIVRSGRRSGLLLPMLEGVDTVAQQVAIAKQKAGIDPDEPVELSRFTVTRYA